MTDDRDKVLADAILDTTPRQLYERAVRAEQREQEKDAEIARLERERDRLRNLIQKHHDDVWGEYGPVFHNLDADLYEAAGVNLRDGDTALATDQQEESDER